jgi:hypothetical protein
MSKRIKVKHSGFSEHCWYNKFCGQDFELITEDADNYWVKTGDKIGSIEKCDGEVIEEEIITHPLLHDLLQQQKNEAQEISLGKRQFNSGAVRDDNKGKIRPDLISPLMLKSLGKVLAEGAEHYGERNWEKGIPQEVFKESASRHYLQWMNNETDEDHASKLIFNVMGFIHNRDKNK